MFDKPDTFEFDFTEILVEGEADLTCVAIRNHTDKLNTLINDVRNVRKSNFLSLFLSFSFFFLSFSLSFFLSFLETNLSFTSIFQI